MIGGFAFLAAARADYQIWRRLARPLFYLTLAGLAVLAIAATLWPDRAPAFVSAFAPRYNGARRWIYIGPISVQVSELARFTLVAYIAARAVELGRKIRDFKQVSHFSGTDRRHVASWST